MRIVLFSDLLDMTPGDEPVALIFTPGDRALLVDALDRQTTPSLQLEQLRQQLSGERRGYSLPASAHEFSRLVAAKAAGQ